MEKILKDEDKRKASMKTIHDGGRASPPNTTGRALFTKRGRGRHPLNNNQDQQSYGANSPHMVEKSIHLEVEQEKEIEATTIQHNASNAQGMGILLIIA
ncbi:hypothetical protein GOP47_0013239 [Adiantum capillus-veneris]|uniref:Uncharacterized protein n=1 Tax=Adiantum capillus-veneris TaxID=13818 RepID=A0A9D4ZCZ8_ADICA|nr:hypothetical protein GOP47_0013239 [Adiantum capillus-veneris]